MEVKTFHAKNRLINSVLIWINSINSAQPAAKMTRSMRVVLAAGCVV